MANRQPASLESAAASVTTLADLALVLRQLRHREARRRGDSELTYRELAAKTGWSHAIIGEYFTGRALPPTHRFDVLIMLLGATPTEQGALATARDRVDDTRRATDRTPPIQPIDPDQPRTPVPRELPSDVAGFVGRDEQLAELDHLLDRSVVEPTVVITALSGAGGVGKTALAVRWAHRVAHRYPDGHLYANLRGYDPEDPVAPADVLAGFLRSLGVDAAGIPNDLAERAARYRTVLSGRRVLILLDNARDAGHVRPLLPGTPTCLAVVTSRDALPGLVARDGAHRIVLRALARDESRSLLRNLIGGRVCAEPEEADRLADQCGRLPLALRLAAELSATNPDASLADLVDDLDDEHRRLDLLDAGGDTQTALRAVFSWSHRHLSPPAADAFCRLGLHPGREFDAHAVAALAGVDLSTAQRLLGELLRVHLVQQPRRLRYTMHDLLRAYAAEQAAARLTPTDRRTALTSLLDYYRYGASVAVIRVFVHHPPAQHWCDHPPDLALPPLDGPAPALAWLDRERANLVAVCGFAASQGWPEHSTDLSQILHPYLDTQYYSEALTVHQHALSVADPGRARAGVQTSLGLTYWVLGRTAEALAHLRQALDSHRAAGGPSDRALAERVTRSALGRVLDSVGRRGEALKHHRAALAIARASNDRQAEAKQLVHLGYALWRLERYVESAAYYRQAMATARAAGLPGIEAVAAGGLGLAYTGLGQLTEALTQLEAGLAYHERFAERQNESLARVAISVVLRRLGRYDEAMAQLERALSISEGVGDQRVRVQALNALGETRRAAGRPDLAVSPHEQALALAMELGDESERDRAREGLEAARRS